MDIKRRKWTKRKPKKIYIYIYRTRLAITDDVLCNEALVFALSVGLFFCHGWLGQRESSFLRVCVCACVGRHQTLVLATLDEREAEWCYFYRVQIIIRKKEQGELVERKRATAFSPLSLDYWRPTTSLYVDIEARRTTKTIETMEACLSSKSSFQTLFFLLFLLLLFLPLCLHFSHGFFCLCLATFLKFDFIFLRGEADISSLRETSERQKLNETERAITSAAMSIHLISKKANNFK